MPDQTVNAGELREGEAVSFRMNGRAGKNGFIAGAGTSMIFIPFKDATEIRRLPPKGRPLAAGDEVKWTRVMAATYWTVKAVSDGKAWVSCDLVSPYDAVAPVSELSRPDGTPITETEHG